MSPLPSRIWDLLLGLMVAAAAAVALLAYFAGSLPMFLVAGGTALATALAWRFGGRTLASAVATLGFLAGVVTFPYVDRRVHRVEGVRIDVALGGQVLRSGADPALCGPSGVGRGVLAFTLKPSGFEGRCRDLTSGLAVQAAVDPDPPQLVGPTQPLTGAEGTAAERTALDALPSRLMLGDGAWSACGSANCGLVFRRSNLLVSVRWSPEESGRDAAAIRRYVEARLADWSTAN